MGLLRVKQLIKIYTRKLAVLFLSLFLIITTTFFLMKAVPGDPFSEEKALPKEIMHALNEHYGLNKPWYEQYFRYLKGVATWNLGPSYKYKAQTVNNIIADGFPVSATLGIEAFLLSLASGVTLGTIAALYQNKWQDFSAMILAIIGISVPSFVLATLLQYVLASKLSIFPIARWTTWWHTILPAVSLASMPTAFIARLTRANLLETLQQNYIRTARAKGIPKNIVIRKHALKNALLPLIPYLGQLAANIFVGSFVIEKIFGIPGLGQWFITSVNNRDYSVIMGVTVFSSGILLVTIFLMDILYTLLDPRVKEEPS